MGNPSKTTPGMDDDDDDEGAASAGAVTGAQLGASSRAMLSATRGGGLPPAPLAALSACASSAPSASARPSSCEGSEAIEIRSTRREPARAPATAEAPESGGPSTASRAVERSCGGAARKVDGLPRKMFNCSGVAHKYKRPSKAAAQLVLPSRGPPRPSAVSSAPNARLTGQHVPHADKARGGGGGASSGAVPGAT